MANQWNLRKWLITGLHILAWMLFFAFPFLLRPVTDTNPARHAAETTGFYYLLLLNNVFRILLFYINAFYFIPRFAYKRKYGQYVFSLLVALALIMAADRYFFMLFLSGFSYRIQNFIFFNFPVFVFLVITSTAFRVIRDRMIETQQKKDKETENLKTELSFLRSQVSPHFMFNVLNNMVALARRKSEDLEPSLIKLSQLLRYMLYETGEDKVMLGMEVEYLRSYVDLQRQRFGKNVKVTCDLQQAGEHHTIEPMLLIPFVENAFKHGTGLVKDAEINVRLQVQNGSLIFHVGNRYLADKSEKDKTSGIGLSNVKRRLELLYPNAHKLLIDDKNGWYTVDLKIQLH